LGVWRRRLRNFAKRNLSDSTDPRRAIIVGGGFSGTLVAIYLLRQGIACISPSSTRAFPGAVSPTRPIWDDHLLNVPAIRMAGSMDTPWAGRIRFHAPATNDIWRELDICEQRRALRHRVPAIMANCATPMARCRLAADARTAAAGSLFETTAVPELRKQAEALALYLSSVIYEPIEVVPELFMAAGI
jgi:glycine/D-amino acid oxidase-like deaminating enzyme